MAKITGKIIKKEELRNKYYWEFMRRNKNFQADLTSLETELSRMLNHTFEEKYGLKRKNGESIRKFVKRIIRKVIVDAKWQYSFWDSGDFKYVRRFSVPDLMPTGRYGPAPWEDNEFLAFYEFELMRKLVKFWEKWKVWYPYMYPPPISEERMAVIFRKSGVMNPPYQISPHIDLIFPKERIMNEIEFWIDFYKKKQIEAKRRGEGTPSRFLDKIRRSRPPWRLFDRYLKIWDLKQKGKNFKEIVKILYPSLKGIKLYSEPNAHMVKKLMRKQDELTKQGYSDDEAEEIAKKELGITTDIEKRRFASSYNRVQRSYQQAEKLINGAYKEL